MAIDTAFPSWILPKESPIDALIKGVQAGTMIAHTQQQAQSLALQRQSQDQQIQLAQQKYQLDAESQGIRNQAASMQIDETRADLPLWQQFTQDLSSASKQGVDAVANLPLPTGFSPKSIVTATHLKTNVLGQMAQTSDAKQYGDFMGDWAKLDGEGKAVFNETFGPVPTKTSDITPDMYAVMGIQKDRIDAQKQADLIAQKSAAATVRGEYQLENTALTVEGRNELQKIKDAATQTDASGNVQSSPLILPDGSVDPFHAVVRSGKANKIVSVKNQADMGALTPSQKVSVLKTLETANRLQSQNFFLSKEDRASHASNAVEWAKQLENLLPGAKKTSAVKTPEDKAGLANQVSKQHPDWTRQQVIDEVNRQAP